MKNNFFRVWILTVIFFAAEVRAEWVTVDAAVDGVVIGQVPVDVNAEGRSETVNGKRLTDLLEPYLEYGKIRRMRDMTDPLTQNLTFTDLSRAGIRPAFNEKELRLDLEIPLDQRVIKDFPLYSDRSKVGLSLKNKPYSGYLNYSVQTTHSAQTFNGNSSSRWDPTEGQIGLVQNLNFFTFESTASYREFEPKPFQRNDTSLVHDEELSQMRYRAGDFFTGVQGFQSSLAAAGLQIQKQFSIRPEIGSLTKRSALIQVKQNSLMEVYVNENLISRIRVTPGPYNLRELPVLYGRNVVRVILIDDFGGREQFEVDMMFDDQILAAGVHDFSYQGGSPSFYVGNEKFYDQKIFTSLYHRYGLSDALTLGAGYQNYADTNLYSLGSGLILNSGTHFIDYAYSQDRTAVVGQAGRWRYNSPDMRLAWLKSMRWFLGAEVRSKDFKSIGYPGPVASAFSEKYDLLLQQQLGVSSSFSLGFSQSKGQNGSPDDSSRRVTYQTYFAEAWMFDVAYDWSRQGQGDQVLLSLTWNQYEGRSSAALAYDSANRRTTARYNRNNHQNYRDYRLGAVATHEDPPGAESGNGAELSAEYFGTVFEPRLRLAGNKTGRDSSTSGQLGVSSALAWTTDGGSFSRPISDAFAIVSPRGLGESEISIPNGGERDNLRLGEGDELVFMNLTSYVDSQLQVDSTSLPAGRYMQREAYVIKPGYRAGVYVPLNVIKSLGVRGRLRSSDAALVAYTYGKIWTASGQLFSQNFFTDESGNFVLDGISYGKYEIELADPRIRRIPIEIKDTDSNEVDLGDITIEKEAGT